MKLKFIIGIIIAIIGLSFASCGDSFDYGDTPVGKRVPTNKEDSLIIVKIYKAMGCDNWPSFDKNALRKPETWRIAGRYYDPDKGEFRVNELIIELAFFRDSKNTKEIVLPDEVGDLEKLHHVTIVGSKDTKIRIPASIFKGNNLMSFRADTCSFENDRIPDEISNSAKKLEVISITNSNLQDANINTLAKFESLELLDLSGNRLSGEVPLDETRELRSKCFIDLGNNYYTSIDWGLFTDNPYVLDDESVPELNGNCLSGEIPEEVFYTRKWCAYCYRLQDMREGYGFTNYKWYDWEAIKPQD